MSQQLDTITRIAMAGALVQTYKSGAVTTNLPQNPAISKLLIELQIETERAFGLFDGVTKRGLDRINKKIEAIKKQTSIGKPLSIITLIEFALAIMDEPCRMCKGARLAACLNVAAVLKALHKEISGGREFILSSIAAAKACDIWDRIEI
jgi:hypothetical protein